MSFFEMFIYDMLLWIINDVKDLILFFMIKMIYMIYILNFLLK